MNRILKVFTACLLSCILFIYSLPAQAENAPNINREQVVAGVANYLPPDIPLNRETEKELMNQNFPFVQNIFDYISWQSFFGVNWPVDDQKKPLPKITDPGTPLWATWKESPQVFLPDGSDPSKAAPMPLCENNPYRKNGKSQDYMRELYATSSIFSNTLDKDVVDEVDQAFTSPLYDQNGKEVRYEIFINDDEYNYIVENKLYNLDGQIEFSQNNKKPVNFPAGNFLKNEMGAIELKLAWKELNINDSSLPHMDIPSRFYTQTVLLPELDSNGEPIIDQTTGKFSKCDQKLVGLVGMHIAHKTESSPQWIWSTFEHVDNLNVDDSEKVKGRPLYALFHDYSPAGQTLAVNVPPIPRDVTTGKPSANGIRRTQVSRPIPIPKAKQKLNQKEQQLLAQAGSPLQYYELIDTQWPTAPYPTYKGETDKGYAAVQGSPFPDNLPEAITRKSTGSPAPVYLTNSIMETYLQAGNQIAHFQENGFPFDNTQVFGTESCMACHFSAGIATGYLIKQEYANGDGKATPQKTPIFGGDLSADFSWLLQLKANWLKQ